MKNPKFIVLEGGEGAGKSTLIKTIKEKMGDSVLITREPGGSPYAEAIRELALKNPLAKNASAETMLCLMFAARFDHVRNTVIPALEKGITVISDRFDASSFAYQIHAQENSGIRELFWHLREAVPRLPDCYIYADVDVKEGLRRVHSRNSTTDEGNHFDGRELAFHERLRTGYKEFLEKVPHKILDANKSAKEVAEDLVKILNEI